MRGIKATFNIMKLKKHKTFKGFVFFSVFIMNGKLIGLVLGGNNLP